MINHGQDCLLSRVERLPLATRRLNTRRLNTRKAHRCVIFTGTAFSTFSQMTCWQDPFCYHFLGSFRGKVGSAAGASAFSAPDPTLHHTAQLENQSSPQRRGFIKPLQSPTSGSRERWRTCLGRAPEASKSSGRNSDPMDIMNRNFALPDILYRGEH